MTYEQGQKSIITEIDALSIRVYEKVLDDYSDAARAILDEMAKLWAGAKDVKPDDMYNYAIQYNRLEKMLQEIEKQYAYYSNLIGKKVADNSLLSINEAYYRNQYQLQFFSGAKNIDLTFSAINPWLVESSIYGTAESWQKIQTDAFKKIYGNPNRYVPQNGTLTSLLTKNASDEIANIRSSISSSLIRGESYREAAVNIKNIIGNFEKTKHGIEASGAMYKSLRIMRTEGNRNLNAGSYAQTQYAKSEGIEIKRQWLATLDGRTRDSHQALDGKFEDKDGLFHIGTDSASYPGNFGTAKNSINCRCTVIDVIPGVDLDERRGQDGEVFSWKNYDEWAENNGLKQNQDGAWYMPTKK